MVGGEVLFLLEVYLSNLDATGPDMESSMLSHAQFMEIRGIGDEKRSLMVG